MDENLTKLVGLLRAEVNVPAGDDDRLLAKVMVAMEYVDKAIGNDVGVSEGVRSDCIVSCAADLYNSRDARLGVMDVGDGSLEPYRVSSDPLRSVWPKLNAAGVPTGGLVIA